LRTSVRWSGSPARLTVSTDSGRPPARTSSAAAEGTVLISRTWSRAASAGSSRAFSASTTRPPRQSGTNSSKTDRSKQIEVEASTPDSSAREKTCPAQRTRAAALRCSIATALGLPDDPEV
jgi:hypothetical protein